MRRNNWLVRLTVLCMVGEDGWRCWLGLGRDEHQIVTEAEADVLLHLSGVFFFPYSSSLVYTPLEWSPLNFLLPLMTFYIFIFALKLWYNFFLRMRRNFLAIKHETKTCIKLFNLLFYLKLILFRLILAVLTLFNPFQFRTILLSIGGIRNQVFRDILKQESKVFKHIWCNVRL